ncbi:ABC transporter permease [Actinomycetota bacterium]|nr:ABC transporter permease [Actinomycetota bacterium]
MNRTIRKIARRELTRTPGRFIAVFLIIVLGAGFLTGLQSAGPGMAGTADHYFSEKRLADLWLYCDKGISAKDVEAIQALPEVAEASASYRVDIAASVNDTMFIASVRSLPEDAAQEGPDYLSQLNLVEGRLPTTDTECVADPASRLQIGDTVIVSENNWETSLDLLAQRSFTVVGLAWSPQYISTSRGNTNIGNGRVSQYLFVPETAFSSDWYTELAVRLATTDGVSAFSTAYAQAIEDATVQLENLTLIRAEQRYYEISNDVSDKLNQGETSLESEKSQVEIELDAAKEQLDSGWLGLSAANAEYSKQSKALSDLRFGLEQSKLDLGAKYQELNAQRGVLDEGRRALQDGRTALAEVRVLRDNLQAALAVETDPAARAALQAQIAGLDAQIATLENQIASGQADVASGEQLLAAAEAAYLAAEAEIKAADQQLAAGTSALENFANQINRTKATLASGTTEYNTQTEMADQEFTDARAELDAGWQDWRAIEWPKWTIENRDDLPGYSGFSADTDRINSLSLVLPWFFFLVAAIVCLTTMTRLVEEHRSQIGTLKANGYRRWQIMAIYQSYAWTIGMTGGAIGVVLGLLVFPPAIWNSYATLYQMGAFEMVITFVPCVVGLLGGAVALSIATAIACRNSLNKNAAELMRPRSPRLGRRVLMERMTFLWRRLSFSHKAMIRNLLRYKLRLAVTVVGVAGCTALLVAGFGLRDSISGVVDMQYGEISSAQVTLVLKNPSSASADTDLNRELNKDGNLFTYACVDDIVVTFQGKTSEAIPTSLFVPEDVQSFTKLVNIRQPHDRLPIAFPLDETQGPAVVITKQLATVLGVHIGDVVSFGPGGTQPVNAQVGAIMENYVYNYLYVTPATYEALVGTPVSYSAVSLRSNLEGEAFDALLTSLVSTDGVATALPVSQVKVIMAQVVANLSAVIWLMVVAAILLAIIIIYNLITINVTERERELATLRVLGYHRREVAATVAREAFVMVFIGIVVGLGGGIVLHGIVMGVLVVSEIMFPHVIALPSFVFAIVIPLVCAIVVNLCIRPRLNRIDPVTSLKSIE